MVIAIKINVVNRQAINRVQNIIQKLPPNMEEAGFQYGKLVQRNMRRELTAQGLIWRRKLWNSIQARRATKTRTEVFMAREGVWLDSMKPHPVWLKKGRLITAWANDPKKGLPIKHSFVMKKLSNITGQIERGIMVKPHPWIANAMARSALGLNRIAKEHLDKTLKGG